MAESCTNREVQGKAFSELQIKCPSEINSNQRKIFNNDYKDGVMESILLPLDLTDSGCDRAGYKKMLGSDDYDNSGGQKDVAKKCSDSSNCHRTSDVTTALFNKETTQTHSSSPLLDSSGTVKRSMSSAFMISSLLSTKSVSSFSTVLSQASSSNSLNLKVTNSTSPFVPGSSSCIARISEARQNAPDFLSGPMNKLGNSEGNPQFGLSKDSSRDIINGQKSETPTADYSLVDISSETADEEDNQENNIFVKTSRLLTENDNFLMLSDSEMDTQMAENESVTSVKEMTTKKTAGEKTSRDSDSHNISHSCKYLGSERAVSNTIESQDLTDDDILIIEDSAHTNSGCASLESSSEDVDANNIKIMNSVTNIDGTADLTRDSLLEYSDSVNESKKCGSTQGSSHINLDGSVNKNELSKKLKPVLSNSDKNKHYNNILEICDVGYSENLDNQKQSRSDYTSFESRTDIDHWKSEKNTNVKKLVKLLAEDNKSSINPVCESRDINKSYSFGDSSAGTSFASDSNNDEPISYVIHKTSEMSNLKTFSECDRKKTTSVCEKSEHSRAATHSKHVIDDRIDQEIKCSDSSPETKPDLSQINSLEIKVDVDKPLEAEDKNIFINTQTLDTGNVRTSFLKGQDHIGNQTMRRDNATANQIPFVEETGRREPGNSCVQKYSFKNILRMPKDNIVKSKKNYGIKEDAEHFAAVETLGQNKSLSTGSFLDGKIGDQKHAELQVAADQMLKDGTSHTRMEVTETVQNNEPVSDRKRLHSEETLSASKRSRLSSMDDKEEKKSKDDASKISDDVVLAEKSVASADSVKLKNVSLSNEALQSLITLRARAFIKNQKQANLDRLNLRTRGMQSASNLWKETAKHLERSVLELAALNQKLESRKAHFLAVKRLASKTVGTQVGDESTSSSGSVSSVQPVPSSNSAQRNSPISSQSPVQRTPNRPGRPPLSSRPVANIPAAAPHERKIPPPNSKAPDTQVDSVNLIDLTDDEDTSRNVDTKASTHTLSHSVNNKLAAGGKTPPPGNGYVQPTPSLMKGTSGSSLGSSSQTVQPTTSGSQVVPSNNSSAGTSDVQFRLVTTDNSPAQHSSPVDTSVPSPRAATAANNNFTSGQSNISANSRALPQNTTSAVVFPAATPSSSATPLSLPPSFLISNKHPAPLPSNMDTGNAPATAKKRPPKPSLKISRVSQGIVLSWNMPSLIDVEKISSYQLYAYQESDSGTPRSNLWKKVGEVKSLPLPMACTLTQFQEGNKYHFAVRAVDQYGRWGSYSDPSSIYLGAKA